jgi:uncharacterized protein (TIGR02246 family)
MFKKPMFWVACLAVLAVGAWYPSAGQDKAPPAAPAKPAEEKPAPPEVAAVREVNRLFAEAFNRGDARAIAALWAENGEYDGPDAERLRGREAIRKAYTDFFKQNPKAALEGRVDSVRLLGPRAAVEEGVLRSGLAGAKDRGETRFSAFLVLEDGGWRFAAAREWVANEAPRVSLDDVAWLAGEWTAKVKDTEVRLTFAWEEGKVFLRGRYAMSRDGKAVASWTQVIAKDPNAGLRSWQFNSDGGFGEWAWARDGSRWVIQGTGTQPDGGEETATNLLVPLDKDAFTWQVLERTAGGKAQPGQPPVKVERVKAGK